MAVKKIKAKIKKRKMEIWKRDTIEIKMGKKGKRNKDKIGKERKPRK